MDRNNSRSSLDQYVPLNIHSSATMPVDQHGRLYHLGLKKGELFNHIITVGDPRRALAISELMDGYGVVGQSVFNHPHDDETEDGEASRALEKKYPHVLVRQSHRGFLTISGKFKGLPVSVIAIGMGPAMMDFFVREAREIVDGMMFIIRFGTCGTVNPSHKVGTFAVNAEGAILVQRSPNHFIEKGSNEPPYRFSKPCFPDNQLTTSLISCLKEHASTVPVVTSMNATCDSFYGSQGRLGRFFVDDNERILEDLVAAYPKLSTLDMETCHLFHMAECIKDKSSNGIKASALKIIVANRSTDTFLIDENAKRTLEKTGGLACLEALKKHHFT